MKGSTTGRIAATFVLALSLLAPQTAMAEVENVWSRWANESWDRETKAEIPFAVLLSLPLMLVITPFWLGQLAMDAIGGDGDDE